jgi:hypothetical protein
LVCFTIFVVFRFVGIDHSPLVEHYYSLPDNYKGLQPDQVSTIKISYKPDRVSTIKIAYKASSSGNKETETLPPVLFFLQAQVHPGSTMATLFEPAAVSPILPRDVAQRVPFRNQADVFATFHIAPSSAEAAAVEHTLSLCQASPHLAGEQMACTTSLEGTVQSSMRMLGTTKGVWAASSALPRAGLPLQPFVVEAVTALDGDRHVGCHSLSFPYAVYYCHSTGLPTKAYMVSLRSVHGDSPPVITLAAICHLDTSSWDPEHPAFKVLHTKPGGAPVCHFMSYASLLFGEKAAN